MKLHKFENDIQMQTRDVVTNGQMLMFNVDQNDESTWIYSEIESNDDRYTY